MTKNKSAKIGRELTDGARRCTRNPIENLEGPTMDENRARKNQRLKFLQMEDAICLYLGGTTRRLSHRHPWEHSMYPLQTGSPELAVLLSILCIVCGWLNTVPPMHTIKCVVIANRQEYVPHILLSCSCIRKRNILLTTKTYTSRPCVLFKEVSCVEPTRSFL